MKKRLTDTMKIFTSTLIIDYPQTSVRKCSDGQMDWWKIGWSCLKYFYYGDEMIVFITS